MVSPVAAMPLLPDGEPSPNRLDSETRRRFQTACVCFLLLLAVGLVFGQTVRYDFVNLDDNVGVYENPQVTHGLTWDAVHWAFTNRLVGTGIR